MELPFNVGDGGPPAPPYFDLGGVLLAQFLVSLPGIDKGFWIPDPEALGIKQ